MTHHDRIYHLARREIHQAADPPFPFVRMNLFEHAIEAFNRIKHIRYAPLFDHKRDGVLGHLDKVVRIGEREDSNLPIKRLEIPRLGEDFADRKRARDILEPLKVPRVELRLFKGRIIDKWFGRAAVDHRSRGSIETRLKSPPHGAIVNMVIRKSVHVERSVSPRHAREVRMLHHLHITLHRINTNTKRLHAETR